MNSEYKESYFMEHPFVLAGIIGFTITTLFLIGTYTMYLDYHEIPIVERTVDSLVNIDGYTECVFVIDGKKYNSDEFPCNNKIGETVKTKLWNNKVSIIEDRK